MIDFLSSWAEQIIIAVVIASIIEMILPDNKNKKYVKMVIGIYILFNIISPIINEKDLISMDSFNLENYAATNAKEGIKTSEVNQTSMDERLQQLYAQELENNIKVKVQEEGYDVSSCKVDAILTGDEKNQGIKKISLVVEKNEANNTDTNKNKSNIESIDKVEINVGLNKYINSNENEKNEESNKTVQKEIQALKDTLSTYYEIESEKINISIK